MDDDTLRAIEAARVAYTDEEWEMLDPHLRTELIYRELRRIDAVRGNPPRDRAE